jgi:hypothetical protein
LTSHEIHIPIHTTSISISIYLSAVADPLAPTEEPSPEPSLTLYLGLNRVNRPPAPTTVKPQLNIPGYRESASKPANKHITRYTTCMAMASDLDLDSIYTFALQLGKDAGQMLLEAAQRRMSGADQLVEEEKLNSVDIVTKTDEGELS